MKVFCTDAFRQEYRKLLKNKSYRTLPRLIIDNVLPHTAKTFPPGVLLKGRPDELPLYKKKLGGTGGYRLYCTLIVKNDVIYFLFVHPKKGALRSSMVRPEHYNELENQLADAIEKEELYLVEADGNALKFIPQKEVEEEE